MAQKVYFLYGKPGCPYCDKAKLLLDNLSIGYEYEEVTSNKDREKLKALYKHPSFPMIFCDNAFIGGFSELQQHLLVWSDF